MDIPFERNEPGWHSVLATFCWLIVTVGGLSLIAALEPILFALGTFTVSGDVTSTVMDRYRLISMRNFGLIFYGVFWLGGVIGLHGYFTNARNTRQLLTRFGAVLFIEAGIWGVSLLVQGLVMG